MKYYNFFTNYYHKLLSQIITINSNTAEYISMLNNKIDNPCINQLCLQLILVNMCVCSYKYVETW